jgi:hypothetical protein
MNRQITKQNSRSSDHWRNASYAAMAAGALLIAPEELVVHFFVRAIRELLAGIEDLERSAKPR